MPVLRKLIGAWHWLENFTLYGLTAGLLFLSLLQIWLRNVHSSGLVWGDSALRVMVFWLAMFGAMIATRQRAHIAIDAITHYVSPQKQRLLVVLTSLAAAAVCLVAAWHSYLFVLDEFEYGGTAFANVPAWLCEAIMPLAFAVIGLRLLVSAFVAPAAETPAS
jgi:C4-dicarboxylate transporter DctQ subunit